MVKSRDENDYLAFGTHGDNGYPVQIFTGGKIIQRYLVAFQ